MIILIINIIIIRFCAKNDVYLCAFDLRLDMRML